MEWAERFLWLWLLRRLLKFSPNLKTRGVDFNLSFFIHALVNYNYLNTNSRNTAGPRSGEYLAGREKSERREGEREQRCLRAVEELRVQALAAYTAAQLFAPFWREHSPPPCVGKGIPGRLDIRIVLFISRTFQKRSIRTPCSARRATHPQFLGTPVGSNWHIHLIPTRGRWRPAGGSARPRDEHRQTWPWRRRSELGWVSGSLGWDRSSGRR